MYYNSKNYEQKYKKYKNKYLELKNQFTRDKYTLNGGECDSLPNTAEEDFVSRENLLDLCPDERITIQNKCYEVRSLYRWIITKNNNILPGTQTRINELEKERLKQMYKILTRPPPRNYLSFLSYDQLPVYVRVHNNDLLNNNHMYKRNINEIYKLIGLGMLEIPYCVTKNIYDQVVALTNRVIKILGFGRRPDIDNMFLTVSDPGTGRYNIDIWKVDLITKNLEKKFHLNIGNWNVVDRNDYIMFASNIRINFLRIPRKDRYTLNVSNSPNLTFAVAIRYIGLKITIDSFVRGYDFDCEQILLDIPRGCYFDCERISLNIPRMGGILVRFHNYWSRFKNRRDNSRGNFIDW
jgi:hypothetical protein